MHRPEFFVNCNMTVVPDDYSISYETHDKAVKEMKEGIWFRNLAIFCTILKFLCILSNIVAGDETLKYYVVSS